MRFVYLKLSKIILFTLSPSTTLKEAENLLALISVSTPLLFSKYSITVKTEDILAISHEFKQTTLIFRVNKTCFVK